MALSGLAVVALLATQTVGEETSKMVVYKDPNCGCCGHWMEHVNAAGFRVVVRNRSSLADIKEQYGISPQLKSWRERIGDSVHGAVSLG